MSPPGYNAANSPCPPIEPTSAPGRNAAAPDRVPGWPGHGRTGIPKEVPYAGGSLAHRGDPPAKVERFYYLGEVKLTSAAGQPMGSQVILFEKIHDPERSTMTERAVVVKPDGKAEEHTMRLAVKGNAFTLTDDAKTIEGAGTLSGPPWRWTYFKATYKAAGGIRIEDENFMADDSVITARKTVTGPDGKVILYMGLKAVTPKTFEILRAALVKA